MLSEAFILFAFALAARSFWVAGRSSGWRHGLSSAMTCGWSLWALLLIWVLPLRWPSQMSAWQQGALLGALIVALWVMFDPRVRKFGRGSWDRALFAAVQWAVGAVFLVWYTFGSGGHDRPILTLELSGKQAIQEADYQLPGTALQHHAFAVHEVLVRYPEGQLTLPLRGDVVSVRSRHLRLTPFLQFLGFGPLIWIDGLRSEVLDPKEAEQFPTQFVALPLPQSLLAPEWLGWAMNVWTEAFLAIPSNWWIDVAQLESSGISMVRSDGTPQAGTWEVWGTPSGVIVRPQLGPPIEKLPSE
ncbi:MAG: hypothetical protein ACOYKZ_06225 [Chlamydiia bacterium]